jgi:hypothetical protein
MLDINTFRLLIDFISYILCIHAFYYINMNNFFIKTTFSKSIIFKVNDTFEPNVLKSIMKTIFITSSPLPF